MDLWRRSVSDPGVLEEGRGRAVNGGGEAGNRASGSASGLSARTELCDPRLGTGSDSRLERRKKHLQAVAQTLSCFYVLRQC